MNPFLHGLLHFLTEEGLKAAEHLKKRQEEEKKRLESAPAEREASRKYTEELWARVNLKNELTRYVQTDVLIPKDLLAKHKDIIINICRKENREDLIQEYYSSQ